MNLSWRFRRTDLDDEGTNEAARPGLPDVLSSSAGLPSSILTGIPVGFKRNRGFHPSLPELIPLGTGHAGRSRPGLSKMTLDSLRPVPEIDHRNGPRPAPIQSASPEAPLRSLGGSVPSQLERRSQNGGESWIRISARTVSPHPFPFPGVRIPLMQTPSPCDRMYTYLYICEAPEWLPPRSPSPKPGRTSPA